jgi:hypothetical protein
MPANIDHFHNKEGPEHFIRVIFQPTMGTFPIPKDFVPWFGKIPSMITLVTNTRCNWPVKTKFDGYKAIIDQGWATFAIAHNLKVGTSSLSTRKLWASTKWLSLTLLDVK